MSAWDLDGRGDLAEAMLPVAANLAMLVHGDGGPEDVQRVLGGLDPREMAAVVVVLAGLVDPEQPVRKALAWMNPAPAARSVPRRPLRDIVASSLPTPAELEEARRNSADLSEDVVAGYLRGDPVEITPEERLAAIVRWVGYGHSCNGLDRVLGRASGYTQKFLDRERRRYHEQGRQFPELHFAHKAKPAFSNEQVVEIREKAGAGAVPADLATEYGVGQGAIFRMISGRSYKQAGGPIRDPRPDPADRRPGIDGPVEVLETGDGEGQQAPVLAAA